MTARETDRALRRLAAGQQAVLSRTQARAVGLSRVALARRLAAGQWELATQRVLRLAGSDRTHHQLCMVAVLDAGDGSVVSHMAAAFLWTLPGFRAGAIDVSRPRARTRRLPAVALVHEPRYLPEHHRTVVEGIPVTTVARTLFDLAGCLHPARAERALDNALTRKLVKLEHLRAVAIELFEHGRTGSALMRQLLAKREAGYIPMASGLEARFFALLVAAGLELPDRQVDLGAEGWVGRVDFYYRSVRLIVEIDSDLHHTSKLDMEADTRRDAALTAAGFTVLRIDEPDVGEQPQVAVAKVRAALQRLHGSSPRSGLRNVPESGLFCRPEQ